jgi:iron complex outermembrane receptor protein
MITNVRVRALLLVSASAIATAVASAAAAQTAPQPVNDTAVEEIVVTAQRRSENLQNVPVSVTAVGADMLRRRGLNDLAQVSLAAPSVQITTDNNFAVRGVGTSAFSSSIESSVAFAQDEVNLTNPSLVSELYDVAQVEVLNGPQGLLFGRNASAGLLNVVTVKPILGDRSGSIDVEGDRRDTAPGGSNGAIVRGAVNIPLGETVALRLAGIYNTQDPLVRYHGSTTAKNDLDLRRYGVRAKLLFAPTDKLSVYVIGDYAEEHGALGLFDITFRELGAGSVNAAPLAALGITPSASNSEIGGDAGYYRDLKRRGLQGKVTYTLDNGVEVSDIAAWKGFDRVQQIDTDGTGQDGANRNFNDTSFDQYSNELRVALPAGNRLSGQAGVYYFHSKLDSAGQVAGNNYLPSFLLPTYPFCVGATAVAGAFPPTCSVSNSYFLGNDRVVRQTNDSYAAFGQLTYRLTDAVQLIGGGRVTHDRLAIDLTQNNDRYFVTLGIPFTGRQKYDNTNFSWKFGGQYTISAAAMVYATYGRGYKGPGFNDNAVSASGSLVVKPETNDNLELGAKTSWFDRRLVLNLSAFSSKFKNYQAQSLDLTTASFVIQNAAELKSRGLEATVIAKPVRGLTLNASSTLLDSKFGDFPGAQCYPTQGCTTFNAKGQRAPLAPKFTGTVDVNYDFNVGGDWRPYVSANLYHRSAIRYDVAPSPGTRYGGVNIVGLNAGVRTDQWRASLFCRNCTDKRVPTAIGIDTGDSFSGITTYNQRFGLTSFRTLGFQVGVDF